MATGAVATEKVMGVLLPLVVVLLLLLAMQQFHVAGIWVAQGDEAASWGDKRVGARVRGSDKINPSANRSKRRLTWRSSA